MYLKTILTDFQNLVIAIFQKAAFTFAHPYPYLHSGFTRKNITTDETSQAITPFHFLVYFHFFEYPHFFEYFSSLTILTMLAIFNFFDYFQFLDYLHFFDYFKHNLMEAVKNARGEQKKSISRNLSLIE